MRKPKPNAEERASDEHFLVFWHRLVTLTGMEPGQAAARELYDLARREHYNLRK